MPVSEHHVRAGRLVLAVALWGALLAPVPAAASSAPGSVAAGQREAVAVDDDGVLRLAPDAPPAPPVFGSYSRFGLYISPARPFRPFRSLRVSYDPELPAGARLLVDVRSSPDGVRWTEWAVGLESGAEAVFDRAGRFAQYRVTLLGGRSSPVVRSVVLAPVQGADYAALQEEQPVAPTFRVRATRMGMVGGRTANGHRIQKRDHFVSLPCTCSLSSRGGNEYMVRITYNGRSAVAPVYDVGPWNIKDNFWDPQERRYFGDLRQGWPQDHAAYFEGHNGGRAAKGRVRFPTAVDVGDGVWWDALGIKGDRAEVEVTFLWMGRDPLESPSQEEAAPPPAEAAPEGQPAPSPEEAAPPPAEAAPEGQPAPSPEGQPSPPPEEAAPPPPEAAPPAEAAPEGQPAPPPEEAPPPPEPTPEPPTTDA